MGKELTIVLGPTGVGKTAIFKKMEQAFNRIYEKFWSK